MKRLNRIVLCVLTVLTAAMLPRILSHTPSANKAAYAETGLTLQYEYARVLTAEVMLYRTGSGEDENENRYFLLPEGYYVHSDDEFAAENGFCLITYDDLTGYVKMDEIDIVSYTPKLKYASGQALRIATPPDADVCTFLEFPYKKAAKVDERGIPDETEDVKFYGSLTVDGNLWYFIEYEGQKGYILGSCAVVTAEIAVNDGAAEPVPEKSPEQGGEGETIPKPLDLTTLIILIAAIGIPAVVILILLFKPRRRRPAYRRVNYEANRIPRYLDEEEKH